MLNLERNKNRIFLKLVSLIMLQVFILIGMVYPEPGSNRLLRVPMGGASDRCSRAFMLTQEQNISLNNKLLFLIITLSKLEAKLNDENWAVCKTGLFFIPTIEKPYFYAIAIIIDREYIAARITI